MNETNKTFNGQNGQGKEQSSKNKKGEALPILSASKGATRLSGKKKHALSFISGCVFSFFTLPYIAPEHSAGKLPVPEQLSESQPPSVVSAAFNQEKPVAVAFSPEAGARNLTLLAIDEAQESIYLAAYYLTDKQVYKKLIEAKKRGVTIKVVVDYKAAQHQHTPANATNQAPSSKKGNKKSSEANQAQELQLKSLVREGIPVRMNKQYNIFHDKFMIIDQKHLQTGSYNYTENAARRNSENVIYLRDQPEVAALYQKHWDRSWENAEPLE